MKLITRYIVDHVTIAYKHHDTGEIVISKRVEELKGVKFKEEDFVEAEDGSNVRTEPDGEGNIIKIDYKYYKPELIEITRGDEFWGIEHIYFRNQNKAMSAGYSKCNHCGKWARQNTRFTYRQSPAIAPLFFCSETCAKEEGFSFCTECRHLKPTSDLYIYITYNGNHRLVCNNCREHEFFTCGRCGRRYSRTERYYNRLGAFCPGCYEQVREEAKEYDIDDYHTAKNGSHWKFFKTPDDVGNLDYIGTELEVEAKKYDPENVAFEARKILNKTSEGILAHFEHDGSLNDGVEIIFNPMTLNYIYSQENLFKTAFDKISTIARSHDTSSCGLHIHYSRGKFNREAIVRLVYLFEKFRTKLEEFARRRGSSYAKFYGWSSLSIDYVARHVDYNEDRYRAVNLRNSDTIEIRIFKGTLKFSTYMASIELVNNFMQAALKFSNEETEKLTFEEIINLLPTKYLIPYCEEKHLLEREMTKVEIQVPKFEPNIITEEMISNGLVQMMGGEDECVLPF